MRSAFWRGTGVRARALFCLLLSIIAIALAREATLVGDGHEYFSMLESFWRHATPDQRPDDIAAWVEILEAHGFPVTRPPEGFFVTTTGHWYSYHFWLYPLASLPAKAALQWLRLDPFFALAATNVVLLVASVALALRCASRSRVVFVVLSVASPVLAYVRWPHAEVFTWACVVTAIVAIQERKLARAALFAAIAALQAPPIFALALLAIGFAAAERRDRGRQVARTVAAASVAGLSPAFYLAQFGVPSLIAEVGMADLRLATPRRVASFLFDLNFGLLAHAPALLGVTITACVLGFFRDRARTFAIASTAIAMLAGGATTTNLNGAAAGLQRYVVWTLPVFAWLVAEQVPLLERRLRPITATLALAHVVSLVLTLRTALAEADTSYAHSPIAKLAIDHVPIAYSPDPEVFVERTLHREAEMIWHRGPLPVVAMGKRGATKILTDGAGLDSLPLRYDVEPSWLRASRARYAGRSDRFYLEPPAGAVVPRASASRFVAYEEGWYDVEHLGEETWRWMSDRAALVVRSLEGARQRVRLSGWVPAELGHAPTLTVHVNGTVVDHFTAPRDRFTREYTIPGSPQREARIEITTSDVVSPPNDERRLGFALLRAELADPSVSLGDGLVHFDGETWLPSFDHSDGPIRCIDGPATLRIDLDSGDVSESLAIGVWVPNVELGRPSNLRVVVDNRVVHDGPVHTRWRRRLGLRSNQSHVVRLEPDRSVDTVVGHAAACIEALRYVP